MCIDLGRITLGGNSYYELSVSLVRVVPLVENLSLKNKKNEMDSKANQNVRFLATLKFKQTKCFMSKFGMLCKKILESEIPFEVFSTHTQHTDRSLGTLAEGP